MKHEMPVMTEEQRQALIGEFSIKLSDQDYADDIEKEAYEIALASLEAETVYQIFDDGKWYDASKRIFDEANERGDICRVVYTAPPVPVMQQVDIGESMVMSRGFVIKAIRAAGGEVKND